MSHKYLTMDDRNKIEILKKENYSDRRIAILLGFSNSTISREIKRCRGEYSAKIAQNNYEEKSKNKGRTSKFTYKLGEFIKVRLNKSWSPEQIVGRYLKGILSFKTIYNWIYSKILSVELNVLRRKGKSRKPKDKRGKFNIGKSIAQRPAHVKKRTEFGHWELDTIVSSRGKSKGCLATFAEMKTRTYIALKMKDRSKDSMMKTIEKLTKSLPKDVFKSFTSDRGKEFACYGGVENQLGIDFYFADPYSAWQRGTNENSNGLLREYYPKKTDLSSIDDKELMEVIYELNTRPRKCLAFNSPFENFLYELNNLE